MADITPLSENTLSSEQFQRSFQKSLQEPLAGSLDGRSLSTLSFVVAFSGGMDSTVLLHLCRQLRALGVIKTVRAVHVHHGLNVLADGWVDHARSLCSQWDIPLSVHRVSCHMRGNATAGKGGEERARVARYAVFEGELKAGECLLQAHHQDDQVETLLYRLVRGTGVDGMRGIPRHRPLGAGRLVRPLLDISRVAIEAYARQNALCWIEDDSNTDTRFDRNFLRAEIVPHLDARWPGAKSCISRFADLCDDASQLLNELVVADYAACSQRLVLPGLGAVIALDGRQLEELSRPRRNVLLRHWLQQELQQQGVQQHLPLPSQGILQQIFDEVVRARPDGEPVLNGSGWCVRRYRHWLLVGPIPDPVGAITLHGIDPEVLSPQLLLSMEGNGGVYAQQACPSPSEKHPGKYTVKTLEGEWSLRGGIVVEPFALPGRRGHKTLKKWLNELAVPAWLRARLPVLHRGHELIAIPGILVAEGWQSSSVEQDGMPAWSLKWQIEKSGNTF